MTTNQQISFRTPPLAAPLAIVSGRRILSFCKVVAISGAAAFFCSSAIAQPASENVQSAQTSAAGFLDMYTEDQLAGPGKGALQEDIEGSKADGLWHDYAISGTASGTDSIDKVFLSEGLSQLDLMQLLNMEEGIEFLTDLSAAQNLRYQLDSNGRLTILDVVLNTNERLRFERDRANGNAEFTMAVMEAAISPEMKRISGDIQSSFYKSGKAAGLSASTIQQFANIFQWQIDFNRDLRAGDRFEILLKQNSDDDKQIVGARLYQKNRTLTAIRYAGDQFYTAEGKQLGSSFSRKPLGEGYRVSSSFNLARKHPITGKVRAHKGTDWGVPIGTEVMAPADGVVVRAVKNHPTAGNYIEIRNSRRYVTRYLHLNSLNVKAGDKVKKGQVIAATGNTGLSTGPHLHYEMYVNGRPVDAMKARLPEGKMLAGAELEQFRRATVKLVAMLDQHDSSQLLAKRMSTLVTRDS